MVLAVLNLNLDVDLNEEQFWNDCILDNIWNSLCSFSLELTLLKFEKLMVF